MYKGLFSNELHFSFSLYIHINLLVNFPANSGKCSHGGSDDLYSQMPATGGINKGTSNPELSPHYHLHRRAGQAAVHATRDFLVGKGNPMRDDCCPSLTYLFMTLKPINQTHPKRWYHVYRQTYK